MKNHEAVPVKILLEGNTQVGKTLIFEQIKNINDSKKKAHTKTIGMESFVREYEFVNDDSLSSYRLMIFDQAGEIRFKSTVKIKNLNIIWFVFDVSNNHSYENLQQQLDKLKENEPTSQIVIVGNIRANTSRVVEYDVAKAFADSKQCAYVELDASINEQVYSKLLNPSLKKIQDKHSELKTESSPVLPKELIQALRGHQSMLRNRWLDRRILSYIFRTGYTSKQKMDEINHFLNGEDFNENILLQGRTGKMIRKYLSNDRLLEFKKNNGNGANISHKTPKK
ncbi:MAG: hypothetical protein A3F11_09550 [Gammaproteobacteria bacterium RIFCSPHIGHO2_12_FULL_37_14]|nr:MAG: hypothetical protein A3F11_09550 [Gammaproteobacteria bacterium RIFCSPHIGHO2_12_FULL_37_14]